MQPTCMCTGVPSWPPLPLPGKPAMSAPGWAIQPGSRHGRPFWWSSQATRPPWGTSRFTPSLRRSTASKGWLLSPLVVPEVAQLSHPYTSVTRRGALPPRGPGIASQARAQLPRVQYAPLLRLPLLRLLRWCRTTPAPRSAAGIRAASARGSRATGAAPFGVSPCGQGPPTRGAGGVGGGSGLPCRGRCCRSTVVVVGVVDAPASAGYRGGCSAPPGRPTAGAPRPPSPLLRPALPPPPLCPVLRAPRGKCHPSTPCSWAHSLPPAPGSGALSLPCPLARVACPYL